VQGLYPRTFTEQIELSEDSSLCVLVGKAGRTAFAPTSFADPQGLPRLSIRLQHLPETADTAQDDRGIWGSVRTVPIHVAVGGNYIGILPPSRSEVFCSPPHSPMLEARTWAEQNRVGIEAQNYGVSVLSQS